MSVGGTVHELKTWPEYFQSVWDGNKNFEFRENDRDYKPGDMLHQLEWNPETKRYTGRHMMSVVGYILHGGVFGLPEDMCIMSLTNVDYLPPRADLIDAE